MHSLGARPAGPAGRQRRPGSIRVPRVAPGSGPSTRDPLPGREPIAGVATLGRAIRGRHSGPDSHKRNALPRATPRRLRCAEGQIPRQLRARSRGHCRAKSRLRPESLSEWSEGPLEGLLPSCGHFHGSSTTPSRPLCEIPS